MTSTDQSAIARARSLLELRRYDEAIQILGPLVAQRPDDPEPLFLVARAMSGAGRSREAIASAERACALTPESSYAHRLRAEILLELKRVRPALLAAKRSVELDPVDAASHWALARAAVARSDMKTAARGRASS